MPTVRTPMEDRESGSILIAVIGIMMVLTVFAVGAYAMADDNLFQSKREKNSTQALHVAEAGLDAALWGVGRSGFTLGTVHIPLASGTASVTTVYNGDLTYRVISTGISTSTPIVTRTLVCEVFALSLWNMLLSSGSASVNGAGGQLNGNAVITGPFYVHGDLIASSGDAKFLTGPLFVKGGDIHLSGSATIGAADASGHVAVFCDGITPTNHEDYYPRDEQANPNVPNIILPDYGQSQLANARQTAIGEAVDGLQGRTGVMNDETRWSVPVTGTPSYPRLRVSGEEYYKVIDDNTQIDTSVVTVTLGHGTGSFGKPTDDFAFDDVTDTLDIKGTVFIDAQELHLNTIRYRGNGTIVCSGHIYIDGDFTPVGIWPYEDSYPNPNAVGLTTPDTITDSAADAWGAFFAYNRFEMFGNDQQFHGALLSLSINLGKHADLWTTPNLPDYLPPSLPGGENEMGLMKFVTRWHEGTN